MNEILKAYKNIFTYKGTSTKKEFYVFFLFSVVGELILYSVSNAIRASIFADYRHNILVNMLWSLSEAFTFIIPSIILFGLPLLALSVRKMRASNLSPAWAILALIPSPVTYGLLLVLASLDGKKASKKS